MAFSPSANPRKARVKPAMNVTPLVDVVLVLLIIFMVITPLLTKQLSVAVPEKPRERRDHASQGAVPVILRIDERGQAFVNRDAVSDAELADKLKRVFAARDDKVLFFDGADGAPFARAVEVIDLARGAGIATIAVLTEPLSGT